MISMVFAQPSPLLNTSFSCSEVCKQLLLEMGYLRKSVRVLTDMQEFCCGNNINNIGLE